MVAVLGPSLTNVVLALSLIGWVGYARLVRGQVLRARELEFVQAARALGAATPRILARHVVPTTLPAVTVQATLGMGGAILAEASLSFLGLGVQPPTPSWGTMLSYGRAHLLDAPHLTIFPGLAIAVLVLGFNFLGDGLRDALDPTTVRARTRLGARTSHAASLATLAMSEPACDFGEIAVGRRIDRCHRRPPAAACARRRPCCRRAPARARTARASRSTASACAAAGCSASMAFPSADGIVLRFG